MRLDTGLRFEFDAVNCLITSINGLLHDGVFIKSFDSLVATDNALTKAG